MAKREKYKKINHKNFLSTLFFCVTLLIYSACYMFENGGINYDTVIGACINILPYCFAVGILGYLTGSILDSPKKIKPKYDKNAIDKMIRDVSSSPNSQVDSVVESTKPIAEEFDIKVNTEADIS